jgi:hypothetical protein
MGWINGYRARSIKINPNFWGVDLRFVKLEKLNGKMSEVVRWASLGIF